MKLLGILEIIHESGFIYNDLKLHNIVLDYNVNPPWLGPNSKQNIFKNVNIRLVDFGLSTRWLDPKTGQHLDQSLASSFRGNLYFSSVNQLQCQTSSRRDDLHSLVYLIIFMLNEGIIPAFEPIFEKELNVVETLRLVLAAK